MTGAITKSTAWMLAVIACAVAVSCFADARASVSAVGPQIGQMAPTLVVTQLDGQVFDLAKLRGKVVLVNYWASWCAPCKKDMPKLDAFYRLHRDNVAMIGISVDQLSDLPKVRTAMATLSYPVALLKDVTDNGFGEPEGVPITWIIDPDGKVRDRMIDVRDELLNQLVVPLLPR